MFEIEIINLINQYKKAQDKYEQNKIKNSISNLINQNQNEYEKFIQLEPLNEETKNLLEECISISQNKEETKAQDSNSKDKQDDFNLIKNKFQIWLENYNQNNKTPNQTCEEIINEIINFYIINRFEVIEKILKLNDSQDFEDFKNMLKNYIRKYYSEKIEDYLNSNNFKSLNFFEKRKKNKQITKIVEEFGKYEFNNQKIREVIS